MSEFVEGDCWGYPKFMYIDNLYREGYLTQEDEGLDIRFYIRPPLYSQQAKDQERYIKILEDKITSMQNIINKYEEMYAEKGIDMNTKNKEEIKELGEENKVLISTKRNNKSNEEQNEDVLKVDENKNKPITTEDDMKEKKVNENEIEDEKEPLMKGEVFDAHSIKVISPNPESKEKIFQEISNRCLSELRPEKQLMLNIKRKIERSTKHNNLKKTSLSATGTPSKRQNEKLLNNSNDIVKSKELEEALTFND